jgi:sugar phosphate permease
MKQQPWVFYGWLVVGCTLMVMALTSGTRMSFGIALVPLSEQFGWTRTTLSTIVLMAGLVTGLFQLVIGVLVDQFGPKRVLAGGVTLLGLSVWLLTMSTAVWQFLLAYGLLGGLGLAATQQVVAAALMGNWFVQRRGLVQSVVGSAGAVGWMLVVPANMFLERSYGWQTMYRSMGMALVLGMLPLVWALIRDRPEDMGLRPYGTPAVAGGTPPVGAGATPGVSRREALRSSRTWYLLYLGFA